jgi:hypothetical protein
MREDGCGSMVAIRGRNVDNGRDDPHFVVSVPSELSDSDSDFLSESDSDSEVGSGSGSASASASGPASARESMLVMLRARSAAEVHAACIAATAPARTKSVRTKKPALAVLGSEIAVSVSGSGSGSASASASASASSILTVLVDAENPVPVERELEISDVKGVGVHAHALEVISTASSSQLTAVLVHCKYSFVLPRVIVYDNVSGRIVSRLGSVADLAAQGTKALPVKNLTKIARGWELAKQLEGVRARLRTHAYTHEAERQADFDEAYRLGGKLEGMHIFDKLSTFTSVTFSADGVYVLVADYAVQRVFVYRAATGEYVRFIDVAAATSVPMPGPNVWSQLCLDVDGDAIDAAAAAPVPAGFFRGAGATLALLPAGFAAVAAVATAAGLDVPVPGDDAWWHRTAPQRAVHHAATLAIDEAVRTGTSDVAVVAAAAVAAARVAAARSIPRLPDDQLAIAVIHALVQAWRERRYADRAPMSQYLGNQIACTAQELAVLAYKGWYINLLDWNTGCRLAMLHVSPCVRERIVTAVLALKRDSDEDEREDDEIEARHTGLQAIAAHGGTIAGVTTMGMAVVWPAAA